MKRLGTQLLAIATVFGLLACQQMPLAPKDPTTSVNRPAHQSVAVDRTMVHSYHLGTDAHAQPYLLIVLNDAGVRRLNDVAKQGQPYDIVLDGRSYTQTAQVNSGFLVLNPAASNWTEQRLAQLLK